MNLTDFMVPDAIVPEVQSETRDEVIRELVEVLAGTGHVPGDCIEEIVSKLVERENQGSTGIGKGIAVPHIKHTSVKGIVGTIGCSKKGIDFSSLDKQPAYSIILLLSPAGDADKHLQAMENIFRNLQNDDFRRFLRQAQTVEQIKEIILEADEKFSG